MSAATGPPLARAPPMESIELAMLLITPSIGLTMNWLIATRSRSAKIAVTMRSIDNFPETAARLMVLATELKLRFTAVSMRAPVSATGPLAKSASAFAAPSSAPLSGDRSAPREMVSSAIGMGFHQMFEFVAVKRRYAFRQMARLPAGGGGAPFLQAHVPENVGRKRHQAETEFEPALPGKGRLSPSPCVSPPNPAASNASRTARTTLPRSQDSLSTSAGQMLWPPPRNNAAATMARSAARNVFRRAETWPRSSNPRPSSISASAPSVSSKRYSLPPASRAASPRILLGMSGSGEGECAGGCERKRDLHFAVIRAVILQRGDLERAGHGAEVRDHDPEIRQRLVEERSSQRFVARGILEHAAAGERGGFDARIQQFAPGVGGIGVGDVDRLRIERERGGAQTGDSGEGFRIAAIADLDEQ